MLTSGWTFSAAVMAPARLHRHTDSILVGAPTGAGANHHGYATAVLSPESGIVRRVSTLYRQEGHPADRRNLIPPDHPAPLTAEAWFAGSEPALEAIEAGTLLSLGAIIESEGLDAALAAWETRDRSWSATPGGSPSSWRQ